ncbi:MAG: DMT family transporter [bacterium]
MKPESEAIGVVLIAVAVVSFAAILIRLCDAPSAVIATYRLGLSVLIMLPAYAYRSHFSSLPRIGISDLAWCSLAGLFLSIHFLSWIESLKYTSVANSVVLVTTSPIFASIFAWIFLKESPGRRTIFAIAMCLAGSMTIGKSGLTGEGGALKGDLLALIGASAFGAYFVVGRKVRRSMDFMQYVFHAYLASSLILLAYSLIGGYSLKGYRSDNYLWFFLLAAGPQVFGHSSLNWALKYLPAPKVAVSILGEPIGSSILAWIFFKEIPTPFLFAGALLILTGTYLALTEKRINGIEKPA